MILYYFGGNRWVPEEKAVAWLNSWKAKNPHLCNQVADPGTCCPVAHGAPENECDCSGRYGLEQRFTSIELVDPAD